MNLNDRCAAYLVPHFQSRNLKCGSVSRACLPVPDLEMQFVASEARANEQHSVSVMFEAQPLRSGGPGIRVLSIGHGQSDEGGAEDAAAQWATGVLPVLVGYLLRSHVCEVEKSPMVVGVAESADRYGWSVHLGPVLARAYGAPGSDQPGMGDLSQFAAFEPIFHTVHPYAAHRKLMWIESFAARYYSNQKVDATCRLNNKDFTQGRDALMSWAAAWPETGATILTKRQFLLFEPTPPEQLKTLSQKLEAELQGRK